MYSGNIIHVSVMVLWRHLANTIKRSKSSHRLTVANKMQWV